MSQGLGPSVDRIAAQVVNVLQRRAAAGAAVAPEAATLVQRAASSTGTALPSHVRGQFESSLGTDLSAVRVHTGADSAAAAGAVGAQAYATGNDIHFGSGRYQPDDPFGLHLLAHEVAHTVQQGGGAPNGQCKLEVSEPGDALEVEADRAADAMVSGQPFSVSGGGAQLQRSPTDPAGAAAPAAPGTAPAAGTAPAVTAVTVTRTGGEGATFLSNEPITLTAAVTGGAPEAASQVTWTVTGVSANAGNGNPHTAANQPTFTFTPNPTNRPTAGSRSANPAIAYRVEAKVGTVAGTFDLTQDERDIIRQEYIDHGASSQPARASIVAPSIAAYNGGNYSLIVNDGMDSKFSDTKAEFATLTQAAAQPAAPAAPGAAPAAPGAAPAAPAAPAAAAPVPAVNVESGYRNPQRNVAVGSNYPTTSKHVWGRALDLVVAGPNATLWQRLRDAGANAGATSICEDGPTEKACSDAAVDHVHLQW